MTSTAFSSSPIETQAAKCTRDFGDCPGAFGFGQHLQEPVGGDVAQPLRFSTLTTLP